MRSKKSLGSLPRPKDLKSNKLEDIQDFLEQMISELDRQWRLLHQDVSTIQIDADGFIYFGGKDTDGSWRVGRIGADWVLEHRDSGVWTTVELSHGT